MSEQDNNTQHGNAQNQHNNSPNHEHDIHQGDDIQAAQVNVDRDGTVLEEAIEAFDPSQNDGDKQTIDNEIDVETYKARIKQLEDDAKSAKEAQARANADAYNAQRRMEQETEKSKKFALQKFAKELLEVVDNLERAIISVQDDEDADNAIMEGVRLTQKSLLTALNKQGVAVIDPLGETFNPDLHEAVGIDSEAEANIVGEVLQKGYTLNGRLLRPAMVRVGQ